MLWTRQRTTDRKDQGRPGERNAHWPPPCSPLLQSRARQFASDSAGPIGAVLGNRRTVLVQPRDMGRGPKKSTLLRGPSLALFAFQKPNRQRRLLQQNPTNERPTATGLVYAMPCPFATPETVLHLRLLPRFQSNAMQTSYCRDAPPNKQSKRRQTGQPLVVATSARNSGR